MPRQWLSVPDLEIMIMSDVAKIILQQLGGNRFVAMTGARSFSSGSSGLSFRIRRSNGIFGVVIRLTPEDLYEMEFLTYSGKEGVKAKKTLSGVHAEDMCRMFTEVTGLDTSLGQDTQVARPRQAGPTFS